MLGFLTYLKNMMKVDNQLTYGFIVFTIMGKMFNFKDLVVNEIKENKLNLLAAGQHLHYEESDQTLKNQKAVKNLVNLFWH